MCWEGGDGHEGRGVADRSEGGWLFLSVHLLQGELQIEWGLKLGERDGLGNAADGHRWGVIAVHEWVKNIVQVIEIDLTLAVLCPAVLPERAESTAVGEELAGQPAGQEGRVELHERPLLLLGLLLLPGRLVSGFLLSFPLLLLLLVPAVVPPDHRLVLVEDHGDSGGHGPRWILDRSRGVELLLGTLNEYGSMVQGHGHAPRNGMDATVWFDLHLLLLLFLFLSEATREQPVLNAGWSKVGRGGGRSLADGGGSLSWLLQRDRPLKLVIEPIKRSEGWRLEVEGRSEWVELAGVHLRVLPLYLHSIDGGQRC